MQDFKQLRKLIRENYLDRINNSNKPFVIYKKTKGFDLYTDFSKKIILNNRNIKEFLSTKFKLNNEERYTKREFNYNKCSRSFIIPSTVVETKVKATCSDGLLIVTLPKTIDASGNSKREITIS